jgi:ribosomal protein L37AE/L43A
VVFRLFGIFIFVVLALIAVVGLIFAFRDKKYYCKNCSKRISASQIVCNHCGTFVDKGGPKNDRARDKHVDGRLQDSFKSFNRDK